MVVHFLGGQKAIRDSAGKVTGETREMQEGQLTDIKLRALVMALSCWTCLRSADLGSEEALMESLKESMVVVVRKRVENSWCKRYPTLVYTK